MKLRMIIVTLTLISASAAFGMAQHQALNRARQIVGHLQQPRQLSAPTYQPHEKLMLPMACTGSIEGCREGWIHEKVICDKKTQQLIACIHLFVEDDNSSSTEFTVSLSLPTQDNIGSATVIYYKKNSTLELELLTVNTDFRGNGYGSMLLAYIKNFARHLGCKEITGIATPYALKEGETRRQMLPKLIKFYRSAGGKVGKVTALEAPMKIIL